MPEGFEPGPPGGSPPMQISGFSAPYDALSVLHRAPKAAERLRSLRQTAADARAVCPEDADIIAMGVDLTKARQTVEKLLRPRNEGGHGLSESDARVRLAQQEADELADAKARVDALNRERTAVWTTKARIARACETWLRAIRSDKEPADHEGEAPALEKRESVIDAIERHRETIKALQDKLAAINRAPYTSAHCKARLREQIEAIADRGAPNVMPLVNRDAEVMFPNITVRSATYNSPANAAPVAAFTEIPDMLALFVWTHRDALLKRLDPMLDAACGPNALSPEDRARQSAKAGAALLEAERAECWLTWRALEQSQPVWFRQDSDPVAILGVHLVRAIPREMGEGPTHGYDVRGG
jgi:hypothetical protein